MNNTTKTTKIYYPKFNKGDVVVLTDGSIFEVAGQLDRNGYIFSNDCPNNVSSYDVVRVLS